jgi:hypothetical protein
MSARPRPPAPKLVKIADTVRSKDGLCFRQNLRTMARCNFKVGHQGRHSWADFVRQENRK